MASLLLFTPSNQMIKPTFYTLGSAERSNKKDILLQVIQWSLIIKSDMNKW